MPVSAVARQRICKLPGFSLLEVLLVLLVIGIMAAVAIPLYLNAKSDGEKKACRANLQYISSCVESARLKSGAIDYTEVIAGGITIANLPRLTEMPVCPAGGTYTLAFGNSADASTFKVQCSVTEHGAFQPGINAN